MPFQWHSKKSSTASSSCGSNCRISFAKPSIQENLCQGLDFRSFSAETTPRTHFLPAFSFARSNAAWSALDHLSIVFALSVSVHSLLFGYFDRQFFWQP